MSNGDPQIDFSKKPEKDVTAVTYESNGVTFTVTRHDNSPKGFFKHVHKPNRDKVTLNGKLQDGTKIGTRGSSIPNVTEVSVYYWNGAHSNPILIGITTEGGNQPGTKYYGKHGPSWFSSTVENMNEKEALDRQNCYINDAVVFNIENSQSGTIKDGLDSKCMKNTRKVSTVSNYTPPPGSNYTVVGYNIDGINDNNRETKISRVTLRGQPITISLPTYAIDTVMLYSYQGSGDVPLMIEFMQQGRNDSKWYESTDQGHLSWREVGSGNTFYDKEDNPQPTAKLSEQLDKVLCKRYNNVTLDLSYNRSKAQHKYCCSDHKSEERISVISGEIRINNELKTSYYKHSIISPGSSIAGIKFYENNGQDKRNNVKLSGVSFPISGIQSVYAFYCQMENPVLIYLCGKSPYRGWYKKDGDGTHWRWIGGIHNSITETHLRTGFDCRQWIKLKIFLTEVGCTGLSDCSTPGKSLDLKKEIQQEMKEEEKIAEEERNRAIEEAQQLSASGPGHASVSGPPSNAGSLQGSGSSESGGKGSDSPRSSSSTPNNGSFSTSSQKGDLGLKGQPGSNPVVSDADASSVGSRSAAGGVTIKLDSKVSYPIDHSGRKVIDVTSYNLNPIKGYSAFQHSYGGNDLKITKFTVEGKGQTFIPKISHIKDVNVVVYFLSCPQSDDPVTKVPLLVYIGSDNGGNHHWYTRKNKNSKKWYEFPYMLGNKPPHKINNLDITLKVIKQALGIDCKGDPKRLVYTPQNDSNEITDLGSNRQNNIFGHSGSVNNAISLAIPPVKLPKLKLQEKLGENFDLQGTSERPSATDPLSISSNQAQYSNNSSPSQDPKQHDQSLQVTDLPNVIPKSPKGPEIKGSEDDALIQVKDKEASGKAPAPKELVTLPQGSADAPEPVSPASVSADSTSTSESAAGTPQKLVATTTVATGSVLWTAFGSTSGTLAGAGGLTGLGWWAFKRSRGDPWVRQI